MIDFIDPTIAALTTSSAPFVFRAIYKIYPQDLDNLTKMAIVTLIGGFVGVGMFYTENQFQTSIEAVQIGLISGASATGLFASIQKLLKPLKSESHKSQDDIYNSLPI